MKRLILLAAALFMLSGCALFQALEIYPQNVTGLITDEAGGFLVSWSVTGGDGLIAVDYGDGITEEVDTEYFEHLYTEAGIFTALFTRGNGRGSAIVTIAAPGFELNLPFWTEGQMVGKWEEILFNPFPRKIGCDNGQEIYRTGLWPENESAYLIPGPFGDKWDAGKLSDDFEMRIYVATTDGDGGSAYGKGGEVVTGEWVALQTFRVIADWPWAKPPYPLEVLPKDIECDPEDPWIPPEIPEDAGYFLVRQEVRSKWGTYEAVQFSIFVGGEGCP